MSEDHAAIEGGHLTTREVMLMEENVEKDRAISRLRNKLCDRTISWEAACKLLHEADEQIASLEGDNEILRNMNKILKESLDACYGAVLGPQEPLGEEFQKVLDDNRDKLYEEEALRGEEVKDANL